MGALSPTYQEMDYIEQKSIAAASIGASFTLVSSIFGAGVIQLIFYSSLDQDVQTSLDGSRNFVVIPAGATLILDLKSNNGAFSGAWGVYVKEIGNPTSGSLYVTPIIVRNIT